MKNGSFLKVLLVGQTLLLLSYTILAFKNAGFNLLTVFVDNIKLLQWNGQFNIDFSCYLMLSGIWIMWRNRFSVSSIMFAIFAMIIGIMAFAPYLLYLTIQENGNFKKILVGKR